MLSIVAIMSLTDGLAFLVSPGLVESNAYSFAGKFFDAREWGLIFLSSAMAAIFSIILNYKPVIPIRLAWIGWLSRFAMLSYGLSCMVFGSSILILTLDGTTSAITGTTKWWLPFILSLRFLTWDSIYKAVPLTEEDLKVQ